MHLFRRALFMALAAMLAGGSHAQDPMHRRLTMREGLPSNTVYAMLQDRQGFLWFGTDAGAVRYDGMHLDTYTVEEGLSDEEVLQVELDRKGRVWFLTANGRPSYMDAQGLQSWRTDSTLRRVFLRSGIRSMSEDRQGTIRFGGMKGELVALMADGTIQEEVLRNPMTGQLGGHVTVCNDARERALVFDTEHLVRPRPERPAPIPGGNDALLVIQEFDGGRILCSTAGMICEWQEDGWQPLVDSTMVADGLQFRKAYPTGPDELWITLRSGGVLWMQREQGRWRAVRAPLFTGDLINTVFLGREGNLWFCTDYGGVIMVTGQTANTVLFRGSRGPREEFTRAHRDAQGAIWCGTNQGDAYRLGERWEFVDLPPAGDMFVRVTGMASWADTLWLATAHDLFRMERTAGDRLIEPVLADHWEWDGPRRAGLKALTRGPDGELVGTLYGAYAMRPGSPYMQGIKDPGIPNVRIYAPHIDHRGTLWFEEQDRLFSRDAQGVRPHTEVKLPPGVRITDITSQGDTLFVATSGHGVLVLCHDSLIARITVAHGLSSDHLRHIHLDRSELFVAGNSGADKVSPPWNTPRTHRYASSIGGRLFHVRDVVADADHAYVLFADGLCRLPREETVTSRPMPAPYIRTVMVNDSTMSDRTIVGLRKGRDRLVVELGVVHFTTPLKVRMEYRLAPSDAWQRVLGGSLELSNLPAGDHVLQVRAGLEDGGWSEPVSLMVVMIPPLWQRWWAVTLLLLASVVGVFLVLRSIAEWRVRSREERVRQRELLTHERQRIAMDLHDDLGAELSSLLLLTRMERERPGGEGLARIEQLAGKLTDKVKEVIWSTDPGLDTLEDTMAFIQRHVLTICQRHGLRARITIPPLLPDATLTAGARRELYLLAKEVLNNTVKHAGATTFHLAAEVRGDRLDIAFTDDGRGGAINGAGAGHGLRNMAERAAALGGDLLVEEARSSGTRITLRIPLVPSRTNG